MTEGEVSPSEDVVATFAQALIKHYGDDAISVAERQLCLADTLSDVTWHAIIRHLKSTMGDHLGTPEA